MDDIPTTFELKDSLTILDNNVPISEIKSPNTNTTVL